jgi:hypothetical protein
MRRTSTIKKESVELRASEKLLNGSEIATACEKN